MNYCNDQGANIASIHSIEENRVAIDLAKDTAYIGAESDGNSVWQWNDGSKWWKPPTEMLDSIEGQAETRIVIRISDKKWHDWNTGGDKLGVICATDGILRKRSLQTKSPSHLFAHSFTQSFAPRIKYVIAMCTSVFVQTPGVCPLIYLRSQNHSHPPNHAFVHSLEQSETCLLTPRSLNDSLARKSNHALARPLVPSHTHTHTHSCTHLYSCTHPPSDSHSRLRGNCVYICVLKCWSEPSQACQNAYPHTIYLNSATD